MYHRKRTHWERFGFLYSLLFIVLIALAAYLWLKDPSPPTQNQKTPTMEQPADTTDGMPIPGNPPASN
jgi:hypothetical protein